MSLQEDIVKNLKSFTNPLFLFSSGAFFIYVIFNDLFFSLDYVRLFVLILIIIAPFVALNLLISLFFKTPIMGLDDDLLFNLETFITSCLIYISTIVQYFLSLPLTNTIFLIVGLSILSQFLFTRFKKAQYKKNS